MKYFIFPIFLCVLAVPVMADKIKSDSNATVSKKLLPVDVCNNNFGFKVGHEQMIRCMAATNAKYYDQKALRFCNDLGKVEKQIFIGQCMENIAGKVYSKGQVEVCTKDADLTAPAVECLRKTGNKVAEIPVVQAGPTTAK